MDAARRDFDRLADARAIPEGGKREALWREDFAAFVAYIVDAAALATGFGLTRLGTAGLDTINRWCRVRQRYGTAVRPQWLADCFQDFGPVVQIGDESTRPIATAQGPKGPITIAMHEMRPLLHVAGREAQWDPTEERRTAARDRLRRSLGHRALLATELDRMENLAAEAGAYPRDARPNLQRDLEWLFWCIRFRMSPEQVAARAGFDEPVAKAGTVARAVRRIARDGAVDLRGLGWNGRAW
jgi:hypothetical protein